jgi:hypothetical protein
MLVYMIITEYQPVLMVLYGGLFSSILSIVCIGQVHFMLSNVVDVLDPLLQLSKTLTLNNVAQLVQIPLNDEGHGCWIIL